MGYYKVPQDIEAEDTILGPLTLKQLIFIIIAGVLGFLGVVLAQASAFLLIPVVPPFLGFLVLGVYRPKDQPVENKLAAYLGYYIKPRKKVWSRDGIVDHVTITAPKTQKKQRTDNRTPDQVRSQLKQLANVVDTRGWSTKQANVQLPTNQQRPDDDRIVAAPARAQQIDDEQPTENEDMFDLDNNPVAQKVTELTEASAEKNRAEALAQMKAGKKQESRSKNQEADRSQSYPTQPQESQKPQVESQKPASQTHNPKPKPQTPNPSSGATFQPQIQPSQNPDPQSQTSSPGSEATPNYNPYPSHMHQHVLRRDGTLSGADTSIDTPSVAPPKTKPQQPPAEPETLDDDDKNELKNMADAGLNIEALQRHGRELEQEHANDGTSGEIIIEH